ncbi:heterotrimeric G protein alpha subunit [Mycena polygramma]|nr:heterotrimeric G protein alpha subunit [Mycena polygramma]
MSAFSPTESDPFYEIMRPPPDETPAQMTARLKREADAQRISDSIDEDIKRDRAAQRKARKELRILLLGQGESGAHPSLNVIRSIILILEVMEQEMSGNVPLEDDEPPRRFSDSAADVFTDKHRMLLIRLAPLRGVEAELKRRLGAGAEPVHPSAPMAATPFDDPAPIPLAKRAPEFFVRSWTDAIDPTHSHAAGAPSHADLDSSTITLMTCKDDMQALWSDPAVQLALDRRKEYLLRINDGFSLRTVVGADNHWVWKLYDVGGCRTMRSAWLPFFENTDVIIFLCPVSCFDERLDEDSRVNRLEDSTLLWRSICSSKLLTKTQLILFLNKCDLLKRKLKRGIKVKTYLPSYGDRPNEVMPVVKYLREKYKEIQKQHSPEPRVAYIYTTTVTYGFRSSPYESTLIFSSVLPVRDRVLRENLVTSNLV